ncbi:hypothetical protein TWF730_008984 [Orbilia blumenaviensis]|uniref:Secreted protein n=1 Tax=Orbilia blumenaviensis TaxID=1796055 RepID=A0AAV9V0B4_9PEZI
MTTAVLAAAALMVLYSGSELALKTCTSASDTSTSASEPTEEMETISHDPSSSLVRMQRKLSSIGSIACLFPSRSSGKSTRSFGSFRKQRHEKISAETDKSRPKYVHTPQHAADSHARTTTPIPFSLRPMSQDLTIHPVKPAGPVPYGMRPMSSEITVQPAKTNAHIMEQEHARNVASQGGRVHVVGSNAN